MGGPPVKDMNYWRDFWCPMALFVGLVSGIAAGIRMESRHMQWVETAHQRGHHTLNGKSLPDFEVCAEGCRTHADVVCAEFRALLR